MKKNYIKANIMLTEYYNDYVLLWVNDINGEVKSATILKSNIIKELNYILRVKLDLKLEIEEE